jgi:hypothetical protein
MEPLFTAKGVGKGRALGSRLFTAWPPIGGGLLLKSEAGNGTTAELWLPLAVNAPVPGAGNGK